MAALVSHDLASDTVDFCHFILDLDDAHLLAGSALAPQALVEHVRVVRNEGVRRAQNVRA